MPDADTVKPQAADDAALELAYQPGNYTTLRVHAVRETDDKNLEECPDTDPAVLCWGLYGRLQCGMLEWLGDHKSRAEATAAGRALHPTLEFEPIPAWSQP